MVKKNPHDFLIFYSFTFPRPAEAPGIIQNWLILSVHLREKAVAKKLNS